MIWKQKVCENGVTAEVRKKAFLTTKTGHIGEDSIDTSGTEINICPSCMILNHCSDNRKLKKSCWKWSLVNFCHGLNTISEAGSKCGFWNKIKNKTKKLAQKESHLLQLWLGEWEILSSILMVTGDYINIAEFKPS